MAIFIDDTDENANWPKRTQDVLLTPPSLRKRKLSKAEQAIADNEYAISKFNRNHSTTTGRFISGSGDRRSDGRSGGRRAEDSGPSGGTELTDEGIVTPMDLGYTERTERIFQERRTDKPPAMIDDPDIHSPMDYGIEERPWETKKKKTKKQQQREET